MEKLQCLDKYLASSLANEKGPEAKIILRQMPSLSNKRAIKDFFKGTEDELIIQRRIITCCVDHLKGSISQVVANSLKKKVFVLNETDLTQEVRAFTKTFCLELMAEFGDQDYAILEN